MENLSSSFPRYPDLPSRITQDMESKDIIRLQRDLTTNALSLMGEGDKQRYDGLSEGGCSLTPTSPDWGPRMGI